MDIAKGRRVEAIDQVGIWSSGKFHFKIFHQLQMMKYLSVLTVITLDTIDV